MSPSLIALLLANAFPIAGVLFLGWTVFPLVLLYWLENLVVGAYNVLKLAVAQPGAPAIWAGKLFLIPFFIVHFGGFTYAHGVFVFALFGARSTPGADPFSLLDRVPEAIREQHLGWGVLALVLSHGISYYWNFINNGEYQRAALQTLMHQPYSRIIILHLTVLFGGWLVLAAGSPLPALVLLIVLKTAADIRAHVRERRKFAASSDVVDPVTVPAVGPSERQPV